MSALRHQFWIICFVIILGALEAFLPAHVVQAFVPPPVLHTRLHHLPIGQALKSSLVHHPDFESISKNNSHSQVAAMNSIKNIIRTKIMSKLHTSIGLVHLVSETILQVKLMAGPTYMTKATPNFIASRMVLGTLVSILGKGRQHEHQSALEKTIVSFAVVLNVWMTFLCFTEYTFPVGCGLPFMASLDCAWLPVVNGILCASVTAYNAMTLALIAFAPNKDRKGLWAMGKSGKMSDRAFAVGYNSILYILPLGFYALGSWNVARQIPSTTSWRTLLDSSPELVNIFGNSLINT